MSLLSAAGAGGINVLVCSVGVLLMGVAELYRGSEKGASRILEKFILAALALLVLAGLQGFAAMLADWQFALTYLLLFSAGCSISWGAVIGAVLSRMPASQFQGQLRDRGDWYLRGWAARSAINGLRVRSIIWGALAALPLALFGYYGLALTMGVVYAAAMPLAAKFLLTIEGSPFDRAVGRMCQRLVGKSHSWPRHEVYRGWLAGLLLLMARACIEIANQATSGWPSHFWGQ